MTDDSYGVLCPALISNAHVKSVVHSLQSGDGGTNCEACLLLNARKVHHALFVFSGVIDSWVRFDQ